jgi:hypothetical protein
MMSHNLPPDVAEADELIPAIGPCEWAGPDLTDVTPVEAMLTSLGQFDDDEVYYVDLWQIYLAEAGCSISATYTRCGELHLSSWRPCDPQSRHRSRYVHFLIEDLDRLDGRRDYLLHRLVREGRVVDGRPAPNIRSAMVALRGYLAIGGRILVTPDGRLEEGAGLPRSYTHGTPAEADQCLDLSRAYYDLRKRYRVDSLIKRVVRMLGQRTDHGWIVLEARP